MADTTTGAAATTVPKPDQYVELSRETTDRIFTLLVEFGDQRDPEYPDQDTSADTDGPVRFDGPDHNEIPEPDRSLDNSTVWEPDYSQSYFQNLYFGTGNGTQSLKTYYEMQSSGRYSVDGAVTDWVKVPYNEARYGRSDGFPCDDIVCNNVYDLVRDGMNAWEDGQEAAGRTPAQIAADLKTFDVWDRYDFDGDGEFNEPDGYIDHLQIIHAGGDQADGDTIYGEDAIWSHRAYAFDTDEGVTGPTGNLLGGTEVGDTGIWAGDYTMQAENGGLSTVAHEYGHDLGLPDHYDVFGGDNGVEWWTLMAQSRLGGEGEAIGTRPGDLSAWDKLQLGWLDYQVVQAGQKALVALGPHEYNTEKPQALAVVLPKKHVVKEYGDPFAGAQMWWSDQRRRPRHDDVRDHSTSPGRRRRPSRAKVRYDIEAGYDYLYAQVSNDGGATWTPLDGTVGGEPFSRDASDNPAIDGDSGGEWVDLAVPLTSVVGSTPIFRFLYRTDGGVALDGFFADDVTITVDGTAVVTSGAESGDEGWTLDGFRATTGTEAGDYDNYYLASYRSYVSFDQYLQTGPYNFGFTDTKPNFVEHFSLPAGPARVVLGHLPGRQQHQRAQRRGPHPPHRRPPRSRSTDGTSRRASGCRGARGSRCTTRRSRSGARGRSCSTPQGVPQFIKGSPAQPTFNDRARYWYPEIPETGVKLPRVGVKLTVVGARGTSMWVKVGR